MLEYWNDGIVGVGKKEKWVVGIFDIPISHHSIIPCPPASPERLAMAGRCEAEAQASKKTIILNKLYKFRDVRLWPEIRLEKYSG